jgi:hypothetical protein
VLWFEISLVCNARLCPVVREKKMRCVGCAIGPDCGRRLHVARQSQADAMHEDDLMVMGYCEKTVSNKV